MLKQIPFQLTFVLFLISCTTHPRTSAVKDSPTAQSTATSQSQGNAVDGALTISPALLKKYEEACRHDTLSSDKIFISKFIDLIKRFNGRKLDTTILTLGNIDGDSDEDSIFTRVYYAFDEIHVDSRWLKNKQVLWRDTITDPYIDLQADLVDSTRNAWVFFGIGVIFGSPELYSRIDVLDSGAISAVYNQGVDDLKILGIKTDTAQYKEYLRNFKGDVLTCGQPESRERLWIWYKPAGRMITYYQP